MRPRWVLSACAVLAAVLAACGGTRPSSTTKRPFRASSGPTRQRRSIRHVKGRHDKSVPILMYHVVGNPGPGQPNASLFVSPTEFQAQMSWLSQHGYHAVDLQQVYDYWRRAVALPAHPVVISFDDGYLGQYTNAFPVMQRLHWPGELNLKVDNIGKGGIERSEVKKLVAAGWEIDSHTITHPDLTRVGAAQLRIELVDSKVRLHRLFGVPVNFFCYPSGRFNPTVVAAVKAAGYLGATTTVPGFASPREGMFTLDRIRIDRGDGAAGLATKLASRGAAVSGKTGE